LTIASNLLLISGWAIVLTAIIVLMPDAMRSAFILAGVAVELLGLGLLLRAQRHLARIRGERG